MKVAIVGAGATGLYLSWKLAKLGHKVTVFEKEKEIKGKVCSGLISERIKNFIPLDKSLIENQINNCLIHFPRKTVNLRMKPIHFVIDRRKLNHYLFGLAKNAGAEMVFNKAINEIPQGFDRVIGCDGALSKTRKLLSLSNPLFRLGVQIFLPIENFSEYVETWPVKNGFIWKIPRGNSIEYGIMSDLKSAGKYFEEFCRKEKISIVQKNLQSAIIPQPRTNIFDILRGRGLVIPRAENITLCGDAAGLTKPWSGGGVIWGLTAADILIKNFPDFKKYRKEVRKFFGPKIIKGKIAARLAPFIGNNFPYLLPSKITRDNDFPLF